jgi:hypothetical protein
LEAVSGGTQARLSGWQSGPYVDGDLAPPIAAGTATPVTAGWYQVRWAVRVEFTNVNEFPVSVRFEQKGYYDEVGLIADLPTLEFDVPAGISPRTKPGVQASLTTGVFFQPAYSGTATINPFLYWEGEVGVHVVLVTGEISKFGDPVPVINPAGGSGGGGSVGA